jgi:hypothetical protein
VTAGNGVGPIAIAPNEWSGAIGLWRQGVDLGLRTEETDDPILRAAELEQEAYDLAEQGDHVGARRRLRHSYDILRLANHEGLLDELPKRETPPFLTDTEIEQLPAVEYLVDQIIPLGATAEVHGPPGSAKSFFALSIACAVATGRGFCGYPVKKGLVVYVAGEGIAGTGARLRAWKSEYGVSGGVNALFKRGAVQLMNPEAVARFVADLKSLPQPPALVVFDTLARCMVGGDENSAKDMGLVIAAVDRIRNETGAAVLLVHHTGKNGESERGSTALRGAVDAMFSLKNDAGRVTLSCEKQKDAAEFAPITLLIKPVLDSCALTTLTNAREWSVERFNKNHRQALEALSRDFLEDGSPAGKWLKASKLPESSFWKVLKDLVTWGYVSRDKPGQGARYTVTADGASAVSPNSQSTLSALSESDRKPLPLESPLSKGGFGESSAQRDAWDGAA